MYKTGSDEELLRMMLKGDIVAFEELYDRKHESIYRFAMRMSGSETIAEDVTQEVFMSFIRDANQFDCSRGSSLSSYLFGMARNRVLRRLEKERFFVVADYQDNDDELLNDKTAQDDPLADLTRNETIEAVRQAVLSLDQHYREVVVLCDLDEMSYAEVAEILGCSIGTIRSRLHRARKILLTKLRAIKKIKETDQSTTTNNLNPAGCIL
jgi:RNA polymerase sigma-70 factor, ECF subfamily